MSWSLRVIWLWNLLVCTLIQYWSWSPGHCTNDYARAGSKTKGAFSNQGRRIYWLLWGNLLDTPTKHISGINHYILSTDFFFTPYTQLLKKLQKFPLWISVNHERSNQDGSRKDKNENLSNSSNSQCSYLRKIEMGDAKKRFMNTF